MDYIADEGYAYTYSRCLNFRDRLLKGMALPLASFRHDPIHPLHFLKSFENGDTLGIQERGCSCLHFPTLRSSGQGSDAFSLRVGLQVAKWFAQAKHWQLESNGTVMISDLNRLCSRWSISISFRYSSVFCGLPRVCVVQRIETFAVYLILLCQQGAHLQTSRDHLFAFLCHILVGWMRVRLATHDSQHANAGAKISCVIDDATADA